VSTKPAAVQGVSPGAPSCIHRRSYSLKSFLFWRNFLEPSNNRSKLGIQSYRTELTSSEYRREAGETRGPDAEREVWLTCAGFSPARAQVLFPYCIRIFGSYRR